MNKLDKKILLCLLKTYGPKALLKETLDIISSQWSNSPDAGHSKVKYFSFFHLHGRYLHKAVHDLQKEPFRDEH